MKLIPTKQNDQGVIKILCPKMRDFFTSGKLPCQFLPLNVFRNTQKNPEDFWIVQALQKFIMYASLNLEKNLNTVKESIFKKVVGL